MHSSQAGQVRAGGSAVQLSETGAIPACRCRQLLGHPPSYGGTVWAGSPPEALSCSSPRPLSMPTGCGSTRSAVPSWSYLRYIHFENLELEVLQKLKSLVPENSYDHVSAYGFELGNRPF